MDFGWIYFCMAVVTMFAGIIISAMNYEDVFDLGIYTVATLAAAALWPLAWALLLIAGAVYKVREMKEDRQWQEPQE